MRRNQRKYRNLFINLNRFKHLICIRLDIYIIIFYVTVKIFNGVFSNDYITI